MNVSVGGKRRRGTENGRDGRGSKEHPLQITMCRCCAKNWQQIFQANFLVNKNNAHVHSCYVS